MQLNIISRNAIEVYVDPLPLQKPKSKMASDKRSEGKLTDYADEFLLLPLEAIRVELDRLEKVLKYFDPEKNPWKAERMETWIKGFFSPIVRLYQRVDIANFTQFYQDDVPAEYSPRDSDEKKIDIYLNQLEADAANITRICKARLLSGDLSSHKEELSGSLTILKRTAWELWNLLTQIFDEWESVWPVYIRTRGEEHFKEMVQVIIAQRVEEGGDAYKMFTCAMLLAAGVPCGHIDPQTGWARQETKQKILTEMPWLDRHFSLSSWTSDYERYRDKLIGCVNGAEPPEPHYYSHYSNIACFSYSQCAIM